MTIEPIAARPKAASVPTPSTELRWTMPQTRALFELPFADLIFRAQSVHRANFDAN